MPNLLTAAENGRTSRRLTGSYGLRAITRLQTTEARTTLLTVNALLSLNPFAVDVCEGAKPRVGGSVAKSTKQTQISH